MTNSDNQSRDLELIRIIDTSPDNLFRAWTEPELIKQWFSPAPWTVTKAETDVRSGGSSLIVMRSPEGDEFPNRGIYLDVVKNERIVFTDAYTEAWQPSLKPFMTGIISFEALGEKTKYTARLLHWSVDDREMHEKMGFYEGWNLATNQLEALVKQL